MQPAAQKVSVIIPCYNAQDHIDATLQSVLQQTHQNFEVILVDDHSKDGTLSKLKEWSQKDNRVKVLQTERNTGGPASGRNIGMKAAQGEWVAFLDADDLWHPMKLETQLNLMGKTGAKFSFTEKYNFSDADEFWKLSSRITNEIPHVSTEFIKHGQLLRKNVIPTSSVLMDKALAQGIAFDTAAKTIAVEDYKKWLYTHQKIDFSLKIEEKLLGYRVHPQNLSKQKYKMFKKVNTLLSEYEVGGRRLGIKKYYFLGTYVVRSVWDIAKRKLGDM